MKEIVKLEDWLASKNAMAFRIFSSTDASDLPTGWTKPTAFSLDGAAFYDGEIMVVFTDEVTRVRLEGKSAKPHRLSELQSWLDANDDVNLIGFGSRSFDSRLLLKHHRISANHLDLSDVLYEASATYYEDHGRRYDLRSLAIRNRLKHTPIPHFSFLMKPVELLIEWQQGLSRNVLRTLAAETELIAKLYRTIVVKKEVRIHDDRTEHPASMDCWINEDVWMASEDFTDANEEE